MALHTLALASAIVCLDKWPSVGAPTIQEIASIRNSCIDDSDLAALLGGISVGAQAVIATGTTANGNPQATSVAIVAATPVPVTQIKAGDIVLGVNIPPDTYVVSTAAAGATVNFSKNATGTNTGLIFARPAQKMNTASGPNGNLLHIPNRGYLSILPGDIIARDNSGWPILVSGAAVAYAGSQWTFT